MSTVHVLTSTRPAALIERLARALGREPLGPFDEETVVVQSQGMARWVRLELARRHGCAASLALPFPALFCRRLATAIDARALDEGFDRDALAWRILALLETGLTRDPAFEALRAYADAEDADTRKRLGLAARLAARFDDYQLYRPDVLLRWERGEAPPDESPHARWQGELWRRLCAGSEAPRHLARWLTDAVERLEHGTVDASALPRRVGVFGVSTLPPLFVRLLHALGRHVPVHAYVLSPPWPEPALREPNGRNPLFAGFGHASRELLALLGAGGTTTEDLDATESPAPVTMLTRLQADTFAPLSAGLRAGVARGPESGRDAPVQGAESGADGSLTVHVCHSPMREMEVLRDQLLAAFAADRTLRPHDVLVMLPDVAAYAPFVEAVFGVVEDGLPRIPFTIADRPVAHESPIADAVLRLLRLVGARWTAAEVVELLEFEAIRLAAGLPDDAPTRALRWIADTNIRWGSDGATRRDRFGLPDVDANSWRAGMDRLLMGYATGPADDLIAGILPAAGQLLGDADALGNFCRWVDRLFTSLDALRTPRTLAEWHGTLGALLADLLRTERTDAARELAYVREVIARLAPIDALSGLHGPIDLTLVRDWLERELAGESFGGSFLAGGVTFGGLKPMRAIPFRVIAMLGLDDAAFPRRDRRDAYDLLALAPRPGDRDARTDDRQLFLDTLLAARDRLVLSYVGRSAKTNAERAPSVCVAELLDVIDRAFVAPGGTRAARDAIVVEHRLQPFSAMYYGASDDARLFTYSRTHARAAASRAAAARGDEAVTPAPFIASPLPDSTADDELVLSIDDLVDCWRNPSRYFCMRVLGLKLPSEGDPLEDVEPMTVDALRRYQVQDEILQRHLRGPRDAARERRVAVARGHLPSGALAVAWHDRLDGDMDEMLDSLGVIHFGDARPIELTGAGWRLVGGVDGLASDERVQIRPARRKRRDEIRAWINHLALHAHGHAVTTRILSKDGKATFGPVERPLDLIAALVAGVRANMRAPIPVFELSSHAYVKAMVSSRSKRSPRECAEEAWSERPYPMAPPPDIEDPHVEICWRGRHPLDDEEAFARWAQVLWAPLLATMKTSGYGGRG